MRKFEFKKSYEEIEIAGEVYKISLKDEDKKRTAKELENFYEQTKKISKIDTTKLNVEETLKVEDEVRVCVIRALNVIFGEGSGEKLYEAADRQTEELFPILFEVASILNERRQEKINKYTQGR